MSKRISVFLAALVMLPAFVHASDFLKIVTEKLRPDLLLELGLKEKQERLAYLQKEKSEFERTKDLVEQNITNRLASIDRQMTQVRANLSTAPEDAFLLKKQSILSEHYQVLKDIRQERNQLAEIRTEYIKQLEDYLADPTCEAFKKEQRIEDLSYYPFEYAQEFDRKTIEQQRKLTALQEQEKNTSEALKNRERIIAALADSYKKKKEELEQNASTRAMPAYLGYTVRQKTDLFVLEGNLYKDRVVLEELKLKEASYKVAIVRLASLSTKLRLDIVKGVYARIKSFVRVSESELTADEQELARKRQHYFATTEGYRADIEKIEANQAELEQNSAQYHIALGADLDDWSKAIKKTYEAYEAFLTVALLNERALMVQRERDYFEAQIALEKEAFGYESVQLESKRTYHRITVRAFRSEAEIADEIKKYATLKADASANRSGYVAKREELLALIEQRKKSFERLQIKKGVFESNPDIFREHASGYNKLVRMFELAEENIRRQVRILERTAGLCAEVVSKVDLSLQRIDFITTELDGIKIWYRPEYVISWQDMQTLVPDVERFLVDTYTYATRTSAKTFGHTLWSTVGAPGYSFWWLLAQLCLFLLILLGVRLYLPFVARALISTPGVPYRGVRKFGLFVEMVADFCARYFVAIALWATALFLGVWYAFPEPYFYVLFYLISIPYMLYLAHRFIQSFTAYNMRHDYAFISSDFNDRFFSVLAVLLYATIVLMFFRAAFVLGNYPQSEVPTILLALNIIIAQIALILWISKERFLSLLPSRSGVWDWLYTQVDAYYYFILIFLIAIIILINPFVGFGSLVRYVLLRLVYTAVVVQCVFWLHDLLKRASSTFFFQTRDETVKERFLYAKTWYGLFVILSLITFIAVALILVAKLWAWPEALAKITSWEDIKSWLMTPLLLKDSDHPISILSLGQLVTFIVGGLFVSLSFDRLVLDRIFDVLLVEPGVQHAVSSITRYLIIVMALFLGVQFVGLGAQVWYLMAAFAFGVGWVIKDPVFDFIAYFIILVQRPIKIGDYVMLDDSTRGVIRRITPRTVILRRRNSTTIIVPNSQMLNRVVTNLNYQIGFVLLDDIFVNISYNEDPAVVREVLVNAIKSSPYILKNPQPIIRLHRFGAYGYVFLVRGYVSSSYTLDIWNITGEIRLVIAQALKKQNIKIAVPLRIMPENLATSSSETLSGTVPEMSEQRSDSE